MKSVRLLAGMLCGAVCLALFSGCETQQSACEREKRLTERMDELQMEIDGRMMGMGAEVANLRANPPVIDPFIMITIMSDCGTQYQDTFFQKVLELFPHKCQSICGTHQPWYKCLLHHSKVVSIYFHSVVLGQIGLFVKGQD